MVVDCVSSSRMCSMCCCSIGEQCNYSFICLVRAGALKSLRCLPYLANWILCLLCYMWQGIVAAFLGSFVLPHLSLAASLQLVFVVTLVQLVL